MKKIRLPKDVVFKKKVTPVTNFERENSNLGDELAGISGSFFIL